MMRTFEHLIHLEKPISINDLDLNIYEGPSLHFPFSRSDLRNKVNDNWNKFVVNMALKKREDTKDSLYDTKEFIKEMMHIAIINSMYRLTDITSHENKLNLQLSITDFKEYIGTTAHAHIDKEFRHDLMSAGKQDQNDPNFYFSNALASSLNIVTSDGMIPLGLRSDKVATYPNVPHVIGGYIKFNGSNTELFNTNDSEIFRNVMLKLNQETGVSGNSVESVDLIGAIRNKITRAPELIYNVALSIDSDEFIEFWENKAQDKFEHKKIDMYDRKGLKKALQDYKGTMVPPGQAALELYLTHY